VTVKKTPGKICCAAGEGFEIILAQPKNITFVKVVRVFDEHLMKLLMVDQKNIPRREVIVPALELILHFTFDEEIDFEKIMMMK